MAQAIPPGSVLAELLRAYRDDGSDSLAAGVNFGAISSTRSLVTNSRLLFRYVEQGALPPQYRQWSDYHQQLYDELLARHRQWLIEEKMDDDHDMLLEGNDVASVAATHTRSLRSNQARRQQGTAAEVRTFNNAQNIQQNLASRQTTLRNRGGEPAAPSTVVQAPRDLEEYLIFHGARNVMELASKEDWVRPERGEGDVAELRARVAEKAEDAETRTVRMIDDPDFVALYTTMPSLAEPGSPGIPAVIADFLHIPSDGAWDSLTPDERRAYDDRFVASIVATPCSKWVALLESILEMDSLFGKPGEAAATGAHKFMTAVVARLMMAFDRLAGEWAKAPELDQNADAEFDIGDYPGQCEAAGPFTRLMPGLLTKAAGLIPKDIAGRKRSHAHDDETGDEAVSESASEGAEDDAPGRPSRAPVCDQLYEYLVGKYPEDAGATGPGKVRRLFYQYLESAQLSDPRAVFLYWVRPYSLPPDPDPEQFPQEKFAVPVRNRYDTGLEVEADGLNALFTFMRSMQLISKTGVKFMREGAAQYAKAAQRGATGVGKTAMVNFFLGDSVSRLAPDGDKTTVTENATIGGARAKEMITMYQHLMYTHFINAAVSMYLTSGAVINLKDRGVVPDPTSGRFIPGIVFPGYAQATLDRVANREQRAPGGVVTAAEIDATYDYLFSRQFVKVEDGDVSGPPKYTSIVPQLIRMYRADGSLGAGAFANALVRLDSVFMTYLTEYAPGTFLDKSARDPHVDGTDDAYAKYIRDSVSRARIYDFRDESAMAFGSAGAAYELMKFWAAVVNNFQWAFLLHRNDAGDFRLPTGEPRDPTAVHKDDVPVPLHTATTDTTAPAPRSWYGEAELHGVVDDLTRGILPHMSYILSPGFVDFIVPYMSLVSAHFWAAARGGLQPEAAAGASMFDVFRSNAVGPKIQKAMSTLVVSGTVITPQGPYSPNEAANAILADFQIRAQLPAVRTPVGLLRRVADAVGYAPESADAGATGKFVAPPTIRRHVVLRDIPNDDDDDATMRDLDVVVALRSQPVPIDGTDALSAARRDFEEGGERAADAYQTYVYMLSATLAAGGQIDPSFFAAHKDAETIHRNFTMVDSHDGASAALLRVARKQPALLLYDKAAGRNLIQDAFVFREVSPTTQITTTREARLADFAAALEQFLVFNEMWLTSPTKETSEYADTHVTNKDSARDEYVAMREYFREATAAYLPAVEDAISHSMMREAEAVVEGTPEAREARRSLLSDVLLRDMAGQQTAPTYVALRNLEIAFATPVEPETGQDGVFVAPVYARAAFLAQSYEAQQIRGAREGETLRLGLQEVETHGAVKFARLEDVPHTIVVDERITGKDGNDDGDLQDQLIQNSLLAKNTLAGARKESVNKAVAMGVGQDWNPWIEPKSGANRESTYRLVRSMQHCRLLGQCQHWSPAQLEVFMRILYPDLTNIMNGFGATPAAYVAVRELLSRTVGSDDWDSIKSELIDVYARRLASMGEDDSAWLIQDLQEVRGAAGELTAVFEDNLEDVKDALQEYAVERQRYVPTSFLVRALLDSGDGTLHTLDREPTFETLLLWCAMRVLTLAATGQHTPAQIHALVKTLKSRVPQTEAAEAGSHMLEHVASRVMAFVPASLAPAADAEYVRTKLVPLFVQKWADLGTRHGTVAEREQALLVFMRILPPAATIDDGKAYGAWLKTNHFGMAMAKAGARFADPRTMTGRQNLYIVAHAAARQLDAPLKAAVPAVGLGTLGWDGETDDVSFSDLFQFNKLAHYQYSPQHIVDVARTQGPRLLTHSINRARYQPLPMPITQDAHATLFQLDSGAIGTRMTFAGLLRRMTSKASAGTESAEMVGTVGKFEKKLAKREGPENTLDTWRLGTHAKIIDALVAAAGGDAAGVEGVFPRKGDILGDTFAAFSREVKAFLSRDRSVYLAGAEAMQREFNALRPFLSLEFADRGTYAERNAEYVAMLRESEKLSREQRVEIVQQIAARCREDQLKTYTIPPSIRNSGTPLDVIKQGIQFRHDFRVDGMCYRMYLLCRSMRLRCYIEQLEHATILPRLMDNRDKATAPTSDFALDWRDTLPEKPGLDVNYFKKTLMYIIAAMASSPLNSEGALGDALLAMFVYSDAYVQDAYPTALVRSSSGGAARAATATDEGTAATAAATNPADALWSKELPSHPKEKGFKPFFEQMADDAAAFRGRLRAERDIAKVPLFSDDYYGFSNDGVALFLSFTTRSPQIKPYDAPRNRSRRPFVADRVAMGFDRLLVGEKAHVVRLFVRDILAKCKWDREGRMPTENPFYLKLSRTMVTKWDPWNAKGARDRLKPSVTALYIDPAEAEWPAPGREVAPEDAAYQKAVTNALYAAQEAFNNNPALETVFMRRNPGRAAAAPARAGGSLLAQPAAGAGAPAPDVVRITFTSLHAALTATPERVNKYIQRWPDRKAVPSDLRNSVRATDDGGVFRLNLVGARTMAFIATVELTSMHPDKLGDHERHVMRSAVPKMRGLVDLSLPGRGSLRDDPERFFPNAPSPPPSVDDKTYNVGVEAQYGLYKTYAGQLDSWRQFRQLGALAEALVPMTVPKQAGPAAYATEAGVRAGVGSVQVPAVVEALMQIEPLLLFGKAGGPVSYRRVATAAGDKLFRLAVTQAMSKWYPAFAAYVHRTPAQQKDLYTSTATSLDKVHAARAGLTLFHFDGHLRPKMPMPEGDGGEKMDAAQRLVAHMYVFLIFLDRQLNTRMSVADGNAVAQSLVPSVLDAYVNELVDHLRRLPLLQKRAMETGASYDGLVGVYTPPTAAFELLTDTDVRQKRYVQDVHNTARPTVAALGDLITYGATVLHTMVFDAWKVTNRQGFDPRTQNDHFVRYHGYATENYDEGVLDVVTHEWQRNVSEAAETRDAWGGSRTWSIQTVHLKTSLALPSSSFDAGKKGYKYNIVPGDATQSVRSALDYSESRDPFRAKLDARVTRGAGLYTGATYNAAAWANFWRMGNSPLAFFVESKDLKTTGAAPTATDGVAIDRQDADVFGMTDFGLWFVHYDRSFLLNWASPHAPSDYGFKELNRLDELDYRGRVIAAVAGNPVWPRGSEYVAGNYFIYAPLVSHMDVTALQGYGQQSDSAAASGKGVGVFLRDDYRSAYDKTPDSVTAKVVGGGIHRYTYVRADDSGPTTFAERFNAAAADNFFFRVGQEDGKRKVYGFSVDNPLAQMMAFVLGVARNHGYSLMHLTLTSKAGDNVFFQGSRLEKKDIKRHGVYEAFREDIELAQLWIATDHTIKRSEFGNYVVSGHKQLLYAMAGVATAFDLYTLLQKPLKEMPLEPRERFKGIFLELFGLTHVSFGSISKAHLEASPADIPVAADAKDFQLADFIELCFLASQTRTPALNAGTFFVVDVERMRSKTTTILATRTFERTASPALMRSMPKDALAYTYMLVHSRRRWCVLRHDTMPFPSVSS